MAPLNCEETAIKRVSATTTKHGGSRSHLKQSSRRSEGISRTSSRRPVKPLPFRGVPVACPIEWRNTVTRGHSRTAAQPRDLAGRRLRREQAKPSKVGLAELTNVLTDQLTRRAETAEARRHTRVSCQLAAQRVS